MYLISIIWPSNIGDVLNKHFESAGTSTLYNQTLFVTFVAMEGPDMVVPNALASIAL